jgi:hypothetical protein
MVDDGSAEVSDYWRRRKLEEAGGEEPGSKYQGGPTQVWAGGGLTDAERAKMTKGLERLPAYPALYGGPPHQRRSEKGEGGKEGEDDGLILEETDCRIFLGGNDEVGCASGGEGDSVEGGEKAEEGKMAQRVAKAEEHFWKEWDYWLSKDKHLTDAFRNYLWHRCMWEHMVDPGAVDVQDQAVSVSLPLSLFL